MGKKSPWGQSRVPILLPWWFGRVVFWEVASAPLSAALFPTGFLSSCPGLLAPLNHFGSLSSMGASGPPLAQMNLGRQTKPQPCQAASPPGPLPDMVLKGQCLSHHPLHPSLHPLKARVQEWQVSLSD